ncbi:hypothetical protein [Campylobacter showae]|uniref:hypothetical protein n=1 Tax=Campylobacter showae TaxID=204 RepID=UPI000F08B46F|nr:hypothetical protein [Campylobacter showae]
MRSNLAPQAGKKAGGATLNFAQEVGKKRMASWDVKHKLDAFYSEAARLAIAFNGANKNLAFIGYIPYLC